MREGRRGEDGACGREGREGREGGMERAFERRRKRVIITPQFPRSPPEI